MDPIKAYLKDIRHIPLLTPKGEYDLAKLVRKGNKDARNEMIRSNLRLVISIAKRYNNLGIPLSDLIEEGNIGLMRAVDKFDPNKGFKPRRAHRRRGRRPGQRRHRRRNFNEPRRRIGKLF